MKIRESTEKDYNGMLKIAKRLYLKVFDSLAMSSMLVDLKIHKSYVAEERGKILGFVVFTSSDGKVRISWIGVDPESQRKGIGSMLLTEFEKSLKKSRIRELRVEIVAEPIEYQPYEKTISFYKKMGFTVEKIERTRNKDTGEEFNLATFVKKL